MPEDSGLISAYLQLGFQALFPLVVGSFKSLKTPASTKAKRKAAAKTSGADLGEDDEDEDEFDEMLGWSDSLAFPILGSGALLGLWALLKYVGKEWINLFLGIYFSLAGVFAVQSTLSTLVNFAIRQTSYHSPVYHIRISSSLKQIFHASISLSSLCLLPISIAIPALYLPLGRPFWISNILALSLATTTLSLLRLDSFLTAFLLLGLLLVYDVFWVFATPVMVTVVKGIDAPIKLLAPKSPLSRSSVDFAMLGLGDIVVPGLLIALCLRFDMYRHTLANPSHQLDRHSSFGRGYWIISMISYVLGLAGTMGIMHWSQKAQPALLYLSPACTLGPLLFALARGELNLLWSFSDGPVEQPKVDDTIEAPSEAAIRAKAAVAEDKAEQVAEEVVQHVEEEDDSWMDGTGVATGQDSSRKKKRGGKKK